MPTPSLASVQTSLTAFQNALAEAKDGGTAKTAAKNAAREVLDAAPGDRERRTGRVE